MLAQNFKAAVDLAISDDQLSALVAVLGMLERDELPYEPKPSDAVFRPDEPTTFNLAAWRCGTAACIGGWAEAAGKVEFHRGGYRCDTGLDRLFYPDDYDDEIGMSFPRMRAVKPQQAAMALRNFLTDGEPRWMEVLAE